MSPSLKVLFVPVEGVGHINACISLGQTLLRANHKVVFAVTERWEKPLTRYGFEVALFSRGEQNDKVMLQFYQAGKLFKEKKLSNLSPFEKIMVDGDTKFQNEKAYKLDDKLGEIIDFVEPDIIVVDQFFTIPSVVNSGIPWVWVMSTNPLTMYGNDVDVPCPSLGKSK